MLDKENLRPPGNPAKQSPNFMESSRTLMERIRELQHQEYSLQASITKTTGPNYRKLLEEKDRAIEELTNRLERQRMDGEYYKEGYESLKAENNKKNSNGNTYSLFPCNQSVKHRMEKTTKQLTREKKREALKYFALCSFYVVLILLTVHVVLLGFLLLSVTLNDPSADYYKKIKMIYVSFIMS